jgi:hypothetical protein
MYDSSWLGLKTNNIVLIRNEMPQVSPTETLTNIGLPQIRLRIVSFDRVEIRLAVVTSHGIKKLVAHGNTYTASSFAHWRDHFPLHCVWVEPLDACDSVSRAPATDSEENFASSGGTTRPCSWALH